MKKESINKKIITFLIISLFLTASFLPNISGDKTNIKIDISKIEKKQKQEELDVKFYSFGLGKSLTTEIQMTQTQVDKLFDKIKQYTLLSADNTQTLKAQRLKEEIIQIAQVDDLIPANMKNKLILENNVDPFFGFKKSTNTNPPRTQTKASALLCNFATTGTGTQFPVLIFPRLVPVLLLPIPRVFFRWNAVDAVTSCGSYLTGKGYIAYGSQTGNALGFWGIGFSLFLPPIMNYAFIGYAVYSSVDAEIIEPWPPNYAPIVSPIYPPDNSFNIPISTSELRFSISDQNKDLMDYIVTTDPDIGTGMGEQVADGTYSIPISGLEGTEDYSWTVSISDGMISSIETFNFKTEPTAPVINDPVPSDDEKYVPVSLAELSFKISDPQSDLMDYTVETVPDIGSGIGTGVYGGTYSVDISGLDFSSEYLWFVNVTDGQNWKHKVFSFQTEPEMTFDPFLKGWQYRKKITIDHNMVDGDLVSFPVLISTIDVDLSNKAQIDGDDILFMDGVGVANRLFHEVEDYDGVSGGLVAWVNIPFLDSSFDTEFYMYYGNPDSCNQQAPELVWDSFSTTVHHMIDYPDNYHIKDSTFNYKDGIKKAPNEPLQSNSGKISKCQSFDGSDDYIDIGDIGYSVHTINLWIKPNVPINHNQNTMCPVDFTTKQYRLVLGAGSGSISIQNVVPPDRLTNVIYCLIDTSWHMITLVWNTIENRYDIYFDSVLQSVDPFGVGHVSLMSCEDLVIGTVANDQYPNFFDGYIDEVCISKTSRSKYWIKTTFDNQNNPYDFLDIGPEVTIP